MDVRIGVLLWPQTDSWPELRDAALRIDRAGLDSLWTWDHLNAIVGPWEQPILEGWTTLAGLGPVTSHATLGLMVGANTFRNPGLTAKLVRPEDFQGRMLISSDPEKHREQIQRFLDLGFDQIYLHNVGRNQAEWIEVFGREVLPKLTA